MKHMLLAIVLAFTYNMSAFSCDNHATPGMLPLPPHGGKLIEAEQLVKHEHEAGGHEEALFFEALYKGKELRIYPLALEEKDHDAFKPLAIKNELKNIKLSAEFPRSKSIAKLDPKISGDVILAKLDIKNAHRFIVNIAAVHDNEAVTAKVQIEKK